MFNNPFLSKIFAAKEANSFFSSAQQRERDIDFSASKPSSFSPVSSPLFWIFHQFWSLTELWFLHSILKELCFKRDPAAPRASPAPRLQKNSRGCIEKNVLSTNRNEHEQRLGDKLQGTVLPSLCCSVKVPRFRSWGQRMGSKKGFHLLNTSFQTIRKPNRERKEEKMSGVKIRDWGREGKQVCVKSRVPAVGAQLCSLSRELLSASIFFFPANRPCSHT